MSDRDGYLGGIEGGIESAGGESNLARKLGVARDRFARPDPGGAVLLVDDDASNLRMMKRMLGSGRDVDVAIEADHAIDLLMDKSYAAVVSDYQMPGRDGLWLLRHISAHYPEMLRFMVSGSGATEIEDELAAGLVHAFFAKPIDRHSFLELLTSQGI